MLVLTRIPGSDGSGVGPPNTNVGATCLPFSKTRTLLGLHLRVGRSRHEGPFGFSGARGMLGVLRPVKSNALQVPCLKGSPIEATNLDSPQVCR